MTIEYDIFCFNRTLYITFLEEYEYLESAILDALSTFYDEWQNSDDGCCCEEYMIKRLSERYAVLGWESIEWEEE